MLFKHIKTLPFLFLFAYMRFCAFCACEIFSLKNKTALIPSFILLLQFLDLTFPFYCRINFEEFGMIQQCKHAQYDKSFLLTSQTVI